LLSLLTIVGCFIFLIIVSTTTTGASGGVVVKALRY